MELGNLVFGNSRGKYKFPERSLVNSREWKSLCKAAGVCSSYGTPEVERDFYGFDNEVFTIRPYYWGDDEILAALPNFHYKPTNFTIDWYKYAFRDSYINKNLSIGQILDVFKKCKESIVKGKKNEKDNSN